MQTPRAPASTPGIGVSATPCPLWQRVAALGMQTVAVMGMTKNTGKTVCMNHLLAQAHAASTVTGLSSIGRDGEERDQVFAIPKPPVKVWPGCLVATARDTLARARVRYKQIDGTGVGSPMGEILIVKVLDAGEMEVAGPSRGHDQHRVIALLRQCGADTVLLDGALGRSHHASPALADGVVLATGAAIGGGIDDVLRKTRDRLAILGIAPAPSDLASLVRPVFEQGGVAAWRRDGTPLFHAAIASINAAAVLLSACKGDVGDVGVLALSGAVGRRLWEAIGLIAARHEGLTVVVADGTRLFLDAAELSAFQLRRGRLHAWRGIRLAGVTLNPYSPFGGGFDAAAFLARARETLPDHLVTDVMLTSNMERP